MSEMTLSLLPSIEKEKIQHRCNVIRYVTLNKNTDDAVMLLDSYLQYLQETKPDEINETFEELKNCRLEILEKTDFYKKRV